MKAKVHTAFHLKTTTCQICLLKSSRENIVTGITYARNAAAARIAQVLGFRMRLCISETESIYRDLCEISTMELTLLRSLLLRIQRQGFQKL